MGSWRQKEMAQFHSFLLGKQKRPLVRRARSRCNWRWLTIEKALRAGGHIRSGTRVATVHGNGRWVAIVRAAAALRSRRIGAITATRRHAARLGARVVRCEEESTMQLVILASDNGCS